MIKRKAGAEAPTKKQKNNTPKGQVLSTLKKNRAGITRSELSGILNMDDRIVREYIAELRDEGQRIGLAPGGGYTYGRKRDFERAVALYEAKVRKEAQRVRKMKKTLETWDQVKINF